MPGCIHISATQYPATPLFLQVVVGKREYSGNIEQDRLSFPVTSLRERTVIMLYNADRELISKTELHTKTIVESGTVDVIFTLDSGGEVILQLQFILNDDDRRRIQELRSSAMKRKQQELSGDGHELNLPDDPLSKRLIEKISGTEIKHDQTKVQKSVSMDDLQDKVIFSKINVDPCMMASRDLLLQSDGRKFEDPNGSKKGHGNDKLESRSSSAVKKMISAFENTSSQGVLSSETGASFPLNSGHNETDKAIIPFGDKGLKYYRSRKLVSFLQNTSQNENGSCRPSSHDGASKQKMRERDLIRSKRRSRAKYQHSLCPFSVEKLHSMTISCYMEYPLNYLVAASSTWLHPHVCVTTASRELRDLLEAENLTHMKHADESEITKSTWKDEGVAFSGESGGFSVLNLNGWLINQGVRAAIMVIACGAIFLSNRQ